MISGWGGFQLLEEYDLVDDDYETIMKHPTADNPWFSIDLQARHHVLSVQIHNVNNG